jgi:hypothetical protein
MEKEKCETKYIMLITYSFDSDYVAVPCKTEAEAIDWMNTYINHEIQTVTSQDGYAPIVREHSETENELIYERDEAYIDSDSSWASYKVIEIGNGFRPSLFK